MSNTKDAGDQAVEFFIKRAEYAKGLAQRHCKDCEYEKGANLYKEAYGYLKKAENSVPNDANVKALLDDVKNKYQEAKKMIPPK